MTLAQCCSPPCATRPSPQRWLASRWFTVGLGVFSSLLGVRAGQGSHDGRSPLEFHGHGQPSWSCKWRPRRTSSTPTKFTASEGPANLQCDCVRLLPLPSMRHPCVIHGACSVLKGWGKRQGEWWSQTRTHHASHVRDRQTDRPTDQSRQTKTDRQTARLTDGTD